MITETALKRAKLIEDSITSGKKAVYAVNKDDLCDIIEYFHFKEQPLYFRVTPFDKTQMILTPMTEFVAKP